jgi:hypothetical protein
LSVELAGPQRALFERTEIRISAGEPLLQFGRGTPAYGIEPPHIHQLSRRAVRLRRVEHQLAVESDDPAHEFSQFADRDVLAHAHVDQRRLEAAALRLVAAQQAFELVVREVHQEDAGVGHVVAVQEFASRRACAPDGDRALAALFRVVELAQQRRDDVAVLRVIVVARAVQIGRHRRQILRAVLAVVAPAHFDPGDLGQRVRAVGRLQGPGQQAVFAHRLRRELGIDAARTEEHEARDAVTPGRMDHVGLDDQVVADEFGRIAVVGDDAAHLRRSEEHVLRFFGGEEGVGGCRVGQIEFRVRAAQDVRAALRLKVADDGRADEAAMARHVDACVDVHDGRCLLVVVVGLKAGHFHQRIALGARVVGFDHFLHQFLQRRLRCPAQLVARAAGVAEQRFHFGRPVVTRVHLHDDIAHLHLGAIAGYGGHDADFVLALTFEAHRDAQLGGRELDELAHAVLHAGGDDEVFRDILLQHEPLHFDVVARMAPVAQRAHVAQIQALLQAERNARDSARDLARDEGFAAHR